MRPPSKTVRVDRAALQGIRIAGAKMSNLCFNLSRDEKNPHAQIMRESYEEWDKAMRALKEAQAGGAA